MIKKIIDYFIPEENKLEVQNYYDSYFFVQTIFFFSSLNIILNISLLKQKYFFGAYIGFTVLLIMMFCLFLFKKTGNLPWLVNIFCGAIFIRACIMLSTSGGINIKTILAFNLFSIIILFSTLVLGKGKVWFYASLTFCISFFILDVKGFNFPNYLPKLENPIKIQIYFNILLFSFFIYILSKVYEGKRSLALKDLNESIIKKTKIEKQIKQSIKELEEKNLIVKKQTDAMESHYNYLSESINSIVEKIELFSKGDLTVKINIGNNDDISKLGNSFNNSVKNIRYMFQNIKEMGEQTGYISKSLDMLTKELLNKFSEQNLQNNTISKNTSNLLLDSSESLKLTEKTSNNSSENKEFAKEGKKVVLNQKKKMTAIFNSIEDYMTEITNLDHSNKKIAQITFLINDISEQTNFLALNAAIEAAKAGEFGKGFAVVADEIRNLSIKTTEATKDISIMILNIQNQTSKALNNMKKIENNVKDGINLSKEAESMLDMIEISSSNLLDMNSEIALISKKQNNNNKDIFKSINNVNEISNENTKKVENINEISNNLKNFTNELEKLIDNFKT